MKIITNKTILHNTASDYVFLAGAVDERTQLSAESHQHIKPIGELSDPANVRPQNLPTGDISEFQKKLEVLINQHSLENGSNTPDFILSEYLTGCIDVWNKSVMRRSDWYGNPDRIGASLDNLA
jgi:hypothetical protein